MYYLENPLENYLKDKKNAEMEKGMKDSIDSQAKKMIDTYNGTEYFTINKQFKIGVEDLVNIYELPLTEDRALLNKKFNVNIEITFDNSLFIGYNVTSNKPEELLVYLSIKDNDFILHQVRKTYDFVRPFVLGTRLFEKIDVITVSKSITYPKTSAVASDLISEIDDDKTKLLNLIIFGKI